MDIWKIRNAVSTRISRNSIIFCESYHVYSVWLFELQQYAYQLVLLDCRHLHCVDIEWFVLLLKLITICMVKVANLYNESKAGSLSRG